MLLWDRSQFQIDASRAANTCDILLRTEAQKPQFPSLQFGKMFPEERNKEFPISHPFLFGEKKTLISFPSIWTNVSKGWNQLSLFCIGRFLDLDFHFRNHLLFFSESFFHRLLASAVVVLETFRTIWCLWHPGRLLASCNLPPRSRNLLPTTRNLLPRSLPHLGEAPQSARGWK